MKVSLNWLKDYVDVRVSPLALANKLTMAGLEVASVERYADDTVLEIEVTANRPDCLSVLGLAQEVAAVLGKKLKSRKAKGVKKVSGKKYPALKSNFITIQNKQDCAIYKGCLITDITVRQSPGWLKQRIEALGIRSINNIVDITNYCLLEYGQPLHAFDYDKIEQRVVVRRARKREKILTIDGLERELDENILVISDKSRAIAVAGIMGGRLSEVGPRTKNLLLESAYFNPVLIRRASRQLGLSSESSYRFERGVDLPNVLAAQRKAVELLCNLAGGKLVCEKQAGSLGASRTRTISFNCAQANKILSLNIDESKAKKIFGLLGLSVKVGKQGSMQVSVPSLRRDLKCAEDLIEELARIYGYDNIPATIPAVRSQSIENPKVETLKPIVRKHVSSLGFSEVINYSLVSKQMLESVGVDEAIKLRNALTCEQEFLRANLKASVLSCVAYNLHHANKDLGLFEIGHVFDSDYRESSALAIVATGKFSDTWQARQDFDLYAIKGTVSTLLRNLGLYDIEFFLDSADDLFVNGEMLKVLCQGKCVGVLGRLNTQTLLKFDIKNAPVFYAEIKLNNLCECSVRDKKFKPLSIYPCATRDLSLVAPQDIAYEQIRAIIISEARSFNTDVKLVDIYSGKQIDKGYQGITIALALSLSERTLTDEEVTDLQNRIIKRLNSELAIDIR